MVRIRALEKAIRDAGLGRTCALAGRVEDASCTLNEAATLFVHPTLYEGSSLVTLEAMAHRRAVVAKAKERARDTLQGTARASPSSRFVRLKPDTTHTWSVVVASSASRTLRILDRS